MADQQSLFSDLPAFSDRFMRDHAGQIVTEPRTALLELIANAYDAGATHIQVRWPSEKGEDFSVSDNGTGMTKDEFKVRWQTLCYHRNKHQGMEVVFPKGVRKSLKRMALGQNGKGRHAPFCFADKYNVTTTKDGTCIAVEVSLGNNSDRPFTLQLLDESAKSKGHGTIVTATVERKLLDEDEVRQLIGSKFLVDPSLRISVNGRDVELLALDGLATTQIDVLEGETVTVHFIDSVEHYRTARLRGITWWVNQRMVGEPSWDQLDAEGAYLDGRTEQAKRFSFVVEANCLKPEVKADWTAFHATKNVNAVRDAVHEHVLTNLRSKLATNRKEKKKAALQNSRQLLGDLPTISKRTIGKFIDEVQEKCPTLTSRDLSRTVQILAKLEQTRSGYDLLKELASCSADDLDTWNTLMQQWTASNAEVVLNELQKRLTLIDRMDALVESPLADELHDLQPLFERGLWIFGPEYEAVDFRSNRGLSEIIGKFLGGSNYKPPIRRPDFVVLPELSIGTYCADSYDAVGEISGIRKVAILELKKGGFCVTQDEADQARNYCKEIRQSGRVQADTEIVAYVLGAKLEQGLETLTMGNITVIPTIYQTILRKAHQRTFGLHERLKTAQPVDASDAEVEEVLKTDLGPTLFSNDEPAEEVA